MQVHRNIFLVTLAFCTVANATGAVPTEAKALIAKVHAASTRNDIPTLRSTMLQEFIWSFGGDASADQAIKYWRENPDVLHALTHATKSKCEKLNGFVQCPAHAGVGYRVGFKNTNEGWRMAYFVTGD